MPIDKKTTLKKTYISPTIQCITAVSEPLLASSSSTIQVVKRRATIDIGVMYGGSYWDQLLLNEGSEE